jgi:hypothetical protein
MKYNKRESFLQQYKSTELIKEDSGPLRMTYFGVIH